MISGLMYSHIAGMINSARGSGLSKNGGIYFIFSKAPAVISMGLLMYAATQNIIGSAIYFLNFYLVLLMGTGFLMIAFKEKGGAKLINEKDEFYPIDWLTDKIAGPVKTEADARRWSVWFGTLIGFCAYVGFFIHATDSLWPLVFGAPVLLYGLLCGAMRYIGGNVWAAVEYIFAAVYFFCNYLAIIYG